MSSGDYKHQRKQLENLIAHQNYNHLLTLYETSFLNSLPYLFLLPNKLIIHHLITLATIFPQNYTLNYLDKELLDGKNSQIGSRPVNQRAMDILNMFFDIVDYNESESLNKNEGDFSFGEFNKPQILESDKVKLKEVLIDTIEEILSNRKPMNLNNINDWRNVKILNKNLLITALGNDPWRLFKWPLSCYEESLKENDEKIYDNNLKLLEHQIWKNYVDILKFFLNVFKIDLNVRSKIEIDQTIIYKFLKQLSQRGFIKEFLKILFFQNPISKNEFMFYKNELVIKNQLLNDSFVNFEDKNYIVKKFIMILFNYFLKTENYKLLIELIDELTYLLIGENFHVEELLDFLFLTVDDDNEDLFNLLIIFNSIDHISKINYLKKDFAFLNLEFFSKNSKSLLQSIDTKLVNVLDDDLKLNQLLKLENSLVFSNNFVIAEFGELNIQELKKLNVFENLKKLIYKKGSLFNRFLKLLYFSYFLLKYYLNLKLNEKDFKFKEFLKKVKTAETFKINNLKKILKNNLLKLFKNENNDWKLVERNLNLLINFENCNIITKNFKILNDLL